MGRRSRQRAKGAERLRAPDATYTSPEQDVLVLRGALTAKTRERYAAVVAGEDRPAATTDDAWQRAGEFLFERLAVRWEVQGVDYARQDELLARFRMASAGERQWIRDVLREHVAEHFPDLTAP
jgi:hypothetical protein